MGITAAELQVVVSAEIGGAEAGLQTVSSRIAELCAQAACLDDLSAKVDAVANPEVPAQGGLLEIANQFGRAASAAGGLYGGRWSGLARRPSRCRRGSPPSSSPPGRSPRPGSRAFTGCSRPPSRSWRESGRNWPRTCRAP